MFTRYKTDENGTLVPVAKVYTSKEHNIHSSQVDKDCLWALRRLWNNGHKAYIVGGAVRDMLLGRKPKDFDIATSASPKQVQNLFWNSRAIGRRFRIVHLYFSSKIIEVTTFRSDEENFEEGNNNIFGTMEQDSHRRDFSINALYYNPIDGHLIDFNDSLGDIRHRVIRSLIPLSYSFVEDPVRMIRAVKYSCTTGFRLKFDVRVSIWKHCQELEKVSISRLTDEMVKIFNSGCSDAIFQKMHRYRMLGFIMPSFDVYMKYDGMRKALVELDSAVSEVKASGSDPALSMILFRIARPVVVIDRSTTDPGELAKELFRQIKVLIAPMTPPNYEIERACQLILEDMGFAGSSRTPARKKSTRVVQTRVKRPSGQKNVKKGGHRKPVAKTVQSPASSAEAHDL